MPDNYASCKLCPRECGADRAEATGYCGAPAVPSVAKIMLHNWEEPCISGTRGSGAVFFSGCNLRCCYCQNMPISRSAAGDAFDARRLADEFATLEQQGAENINLVTAAVYLPTVADALRLFKASSSLPVVYNTSSYEKASQLRRLDGLVDVYLPDLKYFSSGLSGEYSNAADYNAVAVAAIDEMVRQQPRIKMRRALMTSGVLIRHLVLPGHYKDSAAVLGQIAGRWGDSVQISLMRQFTPEFSGNEKLRRRVTTFEYNRLLMLATELGLTGYSQDADSATKAFTPDF